MALPFSSIAPARSPARRSAAPGAPAALDAPRSGFTLIELLLVVTIIGLVAGISVGRISNLVTQNRVVRASTVIRGDLETAFALAGRNRQPMRIQWVSGPMELAVTDRSGTVSYRRTTLAGDAYRLAPGQVTVSSPLVEVFPNGLASDTLSIRISVTRGTTTFSRRVRMTRAGLVQVL
jgi:prepilin-type N-terminal cleavage/methylation domain-containing protein